MWPATAASRRPCSSPITRPWSWNGCRPNEIWSGNGRPVLDTCNLEFGIRNVECVPSLPRWRNRQHQERIPHSKFLIPHSIVLGPAAGILFQEGQRLERSHPVEKQDAVEVIGLVLNDARGEVLGAQLDAVAASIERPHRDVTRPLDAAADVGDAQAALPVLD